MYPIGSQFSETLLGPPLEYRAAEADFEGGYTQGLEKSIVTGRHPERRGQNCKTYFGSVMPGDLLLVKETRSNIHRQGPGK